MHIDSLNCNWWWMPAPSISKFTFFLVCVCKLWGHFLAADPTTKETWFDPQQGQEIFHIAKAPWLALQLTHPPAQLILGPPSQKESTMLIIHHHLMLKNELSYSSNFLCACIVCTGIMSPLQSVKTECFILNVEGQCWRFRNTSVLTRGIMECTNETSLFSSVFMYRTIWVSEWYELNTGWVRYGDVRRKLDWNMLPWLRLQLAAIWNNNVFKKHQKQLGKWSIGSLLYR